MKSKLDNLEIEEPTIPALYVYGDYENVILVTELRDSEVEGTVVYSDDDSFEVGYHSKHFCEWNELKPYYGKIILEN
jgi:hypothetical protein